MTEIAVFGTINHDGRRRIVAWMAEVDTPPPKSLSCGEQQKREDGRERYRRNIDREKSNRERGGEGWSGRDRKGGGGVIINLATMVGNTHKEWGDRDA